MNGPDRLRQAALIARLELRRVFFSKRSFWVYLLALFPSVIFIGHGIDVKLDERRWSNKITSPDVLDSIREGDSEEAVLKKATDPIYTRRWTRRRRNVEEQPRTNLGYYDGKRRVDLYFEGGILQSKNVHQRLNFDEDREVFAGVFHYFYLRLAIFFGCLGIFMNLFRGEMLDKTLHYWFVAPARREVLLIGKYLAGLTAAIVIFSFGVLLCFAALLWPHSSADVQSYWQQAGASQLFWYALSAMLACVGYGSVFLAAGLLLRNPIIPAVSLLLWEGINGFLPDILQKFSVLYYVQALCPVPPPLDKDMSALAKLIFSPAEPMPAATAVLGVLVVTGLVLWAASRAVRRLEINYGTE